MAEMTRKERRQAKRAARKAKRKERGRLWDKLSAAATNFNLGVDLDPEDGSEPKFEQVFEAIWPVMGPTVKWLELQPITGEKTDAVLSTIYTLGEQISKGEGNADTQDKFVNCINKIWGPVRIALNLVKTFTDDKIDDVIDDVIDVGDWLTGNDDDD